MDPDRRFGLRPFPRLPREIEEAILGFERAIHAREPAEIDLYRARLRRLIYYALKDAERAESGRPR